WEGRRGAGFAPPSLPRPPRGSPSWPRGNRRFQRRLRRNLSIGIVERNVQLRHHHAGKWLLEEIAVTPPNHVNVDAAGGYAAPAAVERLEGERAPRNQRTGAGAEQRHSSRVLAYLIFRQFLSM